MQPSQTYQVKGVSAQPDSEASVKANDAATGFWVITLPLLVVLVAIVRKHYRAAMLHKQIVMLEQLWQINVTKR